jgi:hypothetical protein
MWAVCLFAGCAQGFQPKEALGPALSDDGMDMNGASSAGTSAAPSAGNGSGSNSGAAGALPGGEPCMMGESESCACDTGGEGTRICRYDRSSPTEGSFSECMSCAQPMAGSGDDADAEAGSGASGSSGSGSSGGRGGSGGSGASGRGGAGGGGGTGTAGSSGSSGGGGSGSGGSSGGAGSGGSSGGRDQAWCLFVPVPLPGLCK